jgi:hypothetical protein
VIAGGGVGRPDRGRRERGLAGVVQGEEDVGSRERVDVAATRPAARSARRCSADAELAHLHIADSFNHKGSSGLRYIMNPPGTPARIHQHLDIGQGEVDWDAFFGTLRDTGFDGVATVCVFAWEERAVGSSKFMLDRVTKERRVRPAGPVSR